jgi:hypothetical protein
MRSESGSYGTKIKESLNAAGRSGRVSPGAYQPLGNPHKPGVTSSTEFPAGSRK